MGYDRAALAQRFEAAPLEVAQRIGQVMGAVARVKFAGDADGGETLRRELAALGPVFCKVGQTLATRPDIIGADTSRKLGQLQDARELLAAQLVANAKKSKRSSAVSHCRRI